MQNNDAVHTNTNNRIINPQDEVDSDISYTHSRQETLKRKGTEINEILQWSITEKKAATCNALSNISMKINKTSTKTKKTVEKLTKKYCPLAKEIANSPKTFNHIIGKQAPKTVHLPSGEVVSQYFKT